jgi:hypothetical protein
MVGMSWNYRVVQHPNGEFYIHEAFYNKRGDKKPHSITENGIKPFGGTLSELKGDLAYMVEALKKPVLKYKDF